MPRIPLGDWVDSAVDWLTHNVSWLFDAIAWFVNHFYSGIDDVLSAPQPLLLAGIFAVIAWWLRSLRALTRGSSVRHAAARWKQTAG